MDVRLFVESSNHRSPQLDALVSQLINNQIIPSSTVGSCFPYLGQFFSYCRVDPTCTSAGSLQFYAVEHEVLDEDCVASIDRRSSFTRRIFLLSSSSFPFSFASTFD